MVFRGMVFRGNVVRGNVVRGNVVRGTNIDADGNTNMHLSSFTLVLFVNFYQDILLLVLRFLCETLGSLLSLFARK
jgi:hypothetical protein